MKEKTYSVYVHENLSNGKVYIGITSQKPENRWRNGEGYVRGYKKPTPFINAIRKYGWDGFRHHVILTGVSQDRANELEQNLIKLFDSTNRDKGYNLSHGGGGVSGIERSEKFREIQSARMKGVHFSEETRRKMSLAKRGCTPWNKGKHTGATESQITARRNRCKKVRTVDGLFDGITECANFYGVTRTTVARWLSGKQKPTNKYRYINATYVDERND